MAKLGTFCKDCDLYEDNKCLVDRINLFENAGVEMVIQDGSHVIPRVCNAFRKPGYREQDGWQDKLKDETHVRGSIVILADNLNELEYTLDRLSKIDNIDKFNVVVAHDSGIELSSVLSLCSVKLAYLNVSCRSVLCFKNDRYSMMDEAFKYCKNGFTIWLEAGRPFDISIVSKLNRLVNYNMRQVLMVEEEIHSIHSMVSYAMMYKFLLGSNGVPFSSKMREKSEFETGSVSDCIYTWREVDEIIS